MHRDNLERFVVDNREAFDQATPSLKVWAEIDNALEKKRGKRVTLWRVSQIAAAVLVLLVTGALIGNYLTSSPTSQLAATLENIAPELKDLEEYYSEQVNERYQQLTNYQYHQGIESDLAQLDEVMEELKQELLVAPAGSEDQIIDDLIQTYKAKIQILERVLQHIRTTDPKTLTPEDNEVSI